MFETGSGNEICEKILEDIIKFNKAIFDEASISSFIIQGVFLSLYDFKEVNLYFLLKTKLVESYNFKEEDRQIFFISITKKYFISI